MRKFYTFPIIFRKAGEALADRPYFNSTELLAPAGSPAVLEAVIGAGADAVYLGGDRFGARAYADNFTKEQLLQALDYAHLYGRRIYLTINTLFKNQEIDGLYEFLAPLYEHGLDAVIVQDMGVLALVRRMFPDLPIHASTQMTVTGAEGVRFLQSCGVSRVVLSRELSIDEIRHIYEETGMELEVFAHGALCYAYSGQCLFSSMLGGRSGNRGRCAQPCRLAYTASDADGKEIRSSSCLLSLKDLCGIRDLAALYQAGVYSFKIEGRMKQASYAAGVVSFYRVYLDRLQSDLAAGTGQVTEHDMLEHRRIANRRGITTGNYWKRNGGDMITFAGPNFTAQEMQTQIPAKLKITGRAVFCTGEPSQLTASASGTTITVTGQAPEPARSAAVTEEALRERLCRTGDSPFVWEELSIDTQEGLFLPNGVINHLRRDALEALQEALLAPYQRPALLRPADVHPEGTGAYPKQTDKMRLIATVSSVEQLEEVLAYGRMTDIYLETLPHSREQLLSDITAALELILASGRTYAVYLALPMIFREHTGAFYTSIADELRRLPICGFLIRNYEELQWTAELFPEKRRILDHNMYTWNDGAAAFLAEGADGSTVPLELNRSEIFARQNTQSEMVIYGYYPLMRSAQCVHAHARYPHNGCDRCSSITYLTDRRRVRFPVCNYCSECVNVIYNSVPTVLFARMKELRKAGVSAFRLDFTIESREEVRQILQQMSGYRDGSVQPSKEKEMMPHTNGHYTRGVE